MYPVRLALNGYASAVWVVVRILVGDSSEDSGLVYAEAVEAPVLQHGGYPNVHKKHLLATG